MFRPRLALLLSCVSPMAALTAQGTVSLAPDWAPEPKVYATTEALMADSIGLAWDGETPVVVRLQIVELVQGRAERFLSGDTLTIAPGSRLMRLQDLIDPMAIGGSLPVIRWAQASGMIDPGELTVERWDDALVRTLRGEEMSFDWKTEAVLVIGMSVEIPGRPDDLFSLPLLVVRPAPQW